MTDPAHILLVETLQKLVTEAEAGNFHDFESKEYPAPKMVLANKFRMLRNDTLNGKFDNKTHGEEKTQTEESK